MPGKAAKVVISEGQQEILQELCRRHSSSQQLVQRANIILFAFEGKLNSEIAELLGCERHSVGVWRCRWKAAFDRMISVECSESRSMLRQTIVDVLSDEPRSGAPPRFTADQVSQIVAVACEHPDDDADRPVTHWTPKELALEAQRRQIVESISPRQIGRFLKERRIEAAPKPVLAKPETC